MKEKEITPEFFVQYDTSYKNKKLYSYKFVPINDFHFHLIWGEIHKCVNCSFTYYRNFSFHGNKNGLCLRCRNYDYDPENWITLKKVL